MKKITATVLGLGFLTSTTIALAAMPTPASINIVPPTLGIDPSTTIGSLLTSAITIVFIVAAILVLFFLIWGAFQWITSGGDKEGIGKAREKIVQSLVGLVILALAFLIVRVVGQIVNIDILTLNKLPSLQQCTNGLVFDPQGGLCVCPDTKQPPEEGICCPLGTKATKIGNTVRCQ